MWRSTHRTEIQYVATTPLPTRMFLFLCTMTDEFAPKNIEQDLNRLLKAEANASALRESFLALIAIFC